MTTSLVLFSTLAAFALAHSVPASAAPAPPPPGPVPPAVVPAAPAPSPAAQGAVVAINRASRDELESLPGIGPRKAAALVAAREERPFRRPSDLRRVKGFGARTIRRLAPLLSFD